MFAKIALIAAVLGPASALRIVAPTATANAGLVVTNANPAMEAGRPVAVTTPEGTVRHGMLRNGEVTFATPGWPTCNPTISEAAIQQSGGTVAPLPVNSVVQFERNGVWHAFTVNQQLKIRDMHAKWTQTGMSLRADGPEWPASAEIDGKMTDVDRRAKAAGFWLMSTKMEFVPVERFGEIRHFFDFKSMEFHVVFAGELYQRRERLSRQFRLF